MLYVVGAERRSLQDVVGRGVSGRTRKLRKVEAERRGVKGLNRRNPPRGLAFGPGTGAALYCITPWWVQSFTVRQPGGPRSDAPVTRPCSHYPGPMNESERLSRLRHDLSNPLSALLAETQLLLLNESQIDPETVTGLKEIEALAIRMRTMLREV